MHREPLLRLLDDYPPVDAADAATRERFVAFVRRHEDCFERRLVVGHVTGSAWIVDATGTKVLLTHHRKLDRWLQPGGHADGDSDVAAVALREAREETGLPDLRLDDAAVFDLDIHVIPFRDPVEAHEHFDVRFVVRAGEERFVVSDESHALAWVALADLERYTTEWSMLRMRRKWWARTPEKEKPRRNPAG